MSSQFNYELDERQVRMLMKDAESEYNESLWNKFEALAITESKSAIDIGNYVPKFNLSISRSVVVPVMFIILIGGLSAMLFSFVDFKKKEAIDKEVPLVANPENFKKPKEIVTTKITKPVVVKTTPSTVTTNSISVAKVEAVKTVSVEPEVKKLKPEKVLEITNVPIAKPTIVEAKKETIAQPIKKKKKKKEVIEELPTIKAVTNLNEGVSEPELDLK